MLARGVDVGVLFLVGHEVVVGCGNGGFGGAFEAVGCFATSEVLDSLSWGCSVGRCYFDMTCVMRVFGSLPDAQASMRACRLEPLPEMRTVRLCCESDMVHYNRNVCAGKSSNKLEVFQDWVSGELTRLASPKSFGMWGNLPRLTRSLRSANRHVLFPPNHRRLV